MCVWVGRWRERASPLAYELCMLCNALSFHWVFSAASTVLRMAVSLVYA